MLTAAFPSHTHFVALPQFSSPWLFVVPLFLVHLPHVEFYVSANGLTLTSLFIRSLGIALFLWLDGRICALGRPHPSGFILILTGFCWIILFVWRRGGGGGGVLISTTWKRLII